MSEAKEPETDLPESERAAMVALTRQWLVKAVIGLDLCPFARAVHAGNRIRYVVSAARTPEALLEELAVELRFLEGADPRECETTLIIHPYVLEDFLEYNDFLDLADDLVEALEFDGVLQVASFHPGYQFAETEPDDIENFTNRSPYPTLHVLREASVDRALEAFPEPSEIFERNMRTLRHLGRAGWNLLWQDAPAPVPAPGPMGKGGTGGNRSP